MKIRIAATLLALTLPLVAQDVEAKTTGPAVDATFYKAYYLEKGKRDFDGAMAPDAAQVLFEQLIDYAKTQYPNVATGQFGADMQVESINDGPLNFLLEI